MYFVKYRPKFTKNQEGKLRDIDNDRRNLRKIDKLETNRQTWDKSTNLRKVLK